MKNAQFLFPLFFLLVVSGCGKERKPAPPDAPHGKNHVAHASGLALYPHAGYTVIEVRNPWPGARDVFRYVAVEKGATVPDSLSSLAQIAVPVNRIIVSSTTHIPSLEMLDVSDKLIGFPNCDWISSEKVRRRIASGHVVEIGLNQALNLEKIIDLQPDVYIGYGIDNNNPQLDNLRKSGIPVVLNGDWNEPSALGKAEWIKLFGVLFGKQEKAGHIFTNIATDYQRISRLSQTARKKPSVMAGAVFENKWILPQGNSWGSELIKCAGGNYLWAGSKGTGSLSLSFESVFDKASEADFWMGPGQYVSLSQMSADNPDYALFKSFKTKNVFSFSSRKGKTGGVLYYELAPNRPDLVLKDLVKILHPDLLPEHQLVFFERLP